MNKNPKIRRTTHRMLKKMDMNALDQYTGFHLTDAEVEVFGRQDRETRDQWMKSSLKNSTTTKVYMSNIRTLIFNG